MKHYAPPILFGVLALALGGCAIGSTFDDEPMVGLRVGEKTVANAARRIASAGVDIAGTLGLVGGTGALGLVGAWVANRSGAKRVEAARDHADKLFDEGVARGAGVAPGPLPVGPGAAGAAGGGVAAQAAVGAGVSL